MPANNLSKSKTIILAIIYASLFFLLLYAGLGREATTLSAPPLTPEKRASADFFAYLPLQAKAVYIYDTAENKPLYARNEHLPMPLASLTKIMTAVCAVGVLGEDSLIKIEKSDIVAEGPSSLRPGENWRAADLASYMLVESSNDAAAALARAFGGAPALTACMNEKADELGLFDTKFGNESGLDIGLSPGAYGSAKDAALMLAFALREHPGIFEKTALPRYNASSVDGFSRTATNTDRALGEIIGVSASKTGFTDLAGGNLVFAMNAGLGHKVLVAILGSTEEGRFKDAILLSNAVIQSVAEKF